jgi:hypothetical protein
MGTWRPLCYVVFKSVQLYLVLATTPQGILVQQKHTQGKGSTAQHQHRPASAVSVLLQQVVHVDLSESQRNILGGLVFQIRLG